MKAAWKWESDGQGRWDVTNGHPVAYVVENSQPVSIVGEFPVSLSAVWGSERRVTAQPDRPQTFRTQKGH